VVVETYCLDHFSENGPVSVIRQKERKFTTPLFILETANLDPVSETSYLKNVRRLAMPETIIMFIITHHRVSLNYSCSKNETMRDHTYFLVSTVLLLLRDKSCRYQIYLFLY
jgi:hypothetical protein